MELLRNLDDFNIDSSGCALAIGNFDGVHRGHAKIVRCLREHAARTGGRSVVFTFEPHPVRILRPELAPPPLTWIERKAELLARLGVNIVVSYPTSEQFLSLDYQQFFDQIVLQRLGARAMVEGPNFYFGRDRQGDIQTLRDLCEQNGIELEVVEPETNGDEFISSSRIRQAISEGDVDAASEMLTQPYRIRGMVTHGAGRGAAIGFPTANLEAVDTLVPANGVYAGTAWIDSVGHSAAIHIGPNPTFGEAIPKVEVHLLDYHDSLYGRVLEVSFMHRIRDVKHFDHPRELVDQLNQDIELARPVLSRLSEQR